jgi:hypothetical protein
MNLPAACGRQHFLDSETAKKALRRLFLESAKSPRQSISATKMLIKKQLLSPPTLSTPYNLIAELRIREQLHPMRLALSAPESAAAVP